MNSFSICLEKENEENNESYRLRIIQKSSFLTIPLLSLPFSTCSDEDMIHTGCIIFLLFSIFSFIHFCLFKKFIWSLTSTMVIIAKAYDADFRSQMT